MSSNRRDQVPWESDPEFDAWVHSLPEKTWAKADISACRLGWEAHKKAATLSQHAEWPSDADVARDVGRRLFDGLISRLLSEREVQDAVIAALQSVCPPDADLWESRELGADERYVGVVPNSTPDAGVVPELIAHRHARQVPDGWALVPIQMTEEMDRAGWPADTAQEGWERAIKAAPPAPEKD